MRRIARGAAGLGEEMRLRMTDFFCPFCSCAVAGAVDRCCTVDARPAWIAVASAVDAGAAACAVARAVAEIACECRAIVPGPQMVAYARSVVASTISRTCIHAWPDAAVISAESVLAGALSLETRAMSGAIVHTQLLRAICSRPPRVTPAFTGIGVARSMV